MHASPAFRFARIDDQAIDWRLRRNCSVTPRQLGLMYASLCVVVGLIVGWFWMLGARFVAGFAGLELLAVGAAFLAYARHATDGETVTLRDGRLIVERELAGRRERVEFGCGQVRIEWMACREGLIELRGQGRRVELGRFMRPEHRQQLAVEMRSAVQALGAADVR